MLEHRHEKRKEPLVFSVVRKTMPALRSSAMKDFFNILKAEGIYNEKQHNKTDNIYRMGSCEIEFFGLDEPQKVRGRKRHYLWINEANELDEEDFIQLNIRTDGQIYLDYNPSDLNLWIYELPPDKVTMIHSTYLDNPFNSPQLIQKIEGLKEQSDTHWTIYGLGKRAASSELIYTNWDIVDSMPNTYDKIAYGIDFGEVSPSVLVECRFKGLEVWIEELIYEGGLTNAQFMQRADALIKERNPEIYADSAQPTCIKEFIDYRRSNLPNGEHGGMFCVYPCEKGPKSVKDGIDIVQRCKLHFLRGDVNGIKEVRVYRWRKFKDILLDEPVKYKDHLMDAMRYCIEGVLRGMAGILTLSDAKSVEVEEGEAVSIVSNY
jgi:phage terminase large subunit